MEAGITRFGRRALAVFVAFMLFASLLLLMAGPVGAASVSPEFLSGASNTDKTCATNEGSGQTWLELKVDPPGGGNYSNGTLSVSITNYTSNGFDWTSNIGVDAVIVKTGQDGANLYRYDPPAEVTGDTGLETPDKNAISHISFCYDTGGDTTSTTVKDSTTTSENKYTTTSSKDSTTSTAKDSTTSTSHGSTSTSQGSTSTSQGSTSTSQDTTTTSEDTTTTSISGSSSSTAPSRESTTTAVSGETVTTGAPGESTSSTIDDEVLNTTITAAPSSTVEVVDELPFTGVDTGMLALLAGGIGLMGALVLAATRREES